MNISNLSRCLKETLPGHEQHHQSPASSVLSVYELLENVLSFLLPTDLRAARLVSIQWHAIIKRSQNLNQTWAIRDRHLSIALLGDEGVGKKTLIEHWSDGYSSRNAMRLSQKQLYWHDELWIVDVEIMPTELDYYRALFKQLLDSHHAYLIVYSMTSQNSFQNVRWRQRRMEHVLSNEIPLLAIVSTKQDLVKEREVTRREGQHEAVLLETQYLETSTQMAGPQGGVLIPIIERYRNMYMRNRKSTSTWTSTLTGDGRSKDSVSGQERRRSPVALLKAMAARMRP